jgi:AcrR family transcriptional regulator
MPDVVVRRDTPGGKVALGATSEERERLTDAVTRIGTERGFRGIDAEQVARRSGVPVEEFHRHFRSVDQCVMAAFERFAEDLLEQVDEACVEAVDWPDTVRRGVEAAFEFVAELEPVARLFAVDVARVGPAAIEFRQASIERAALRLKHGRLLYPAAADLPDALERTLIAGVVTNVSAHLLREEREMLAEAEAEVVEVLLAPYIGVDQAHFAAAD